MHYSPIGNCELTGFQQCSWFVYHSFTVFRRHSNVVLCVLFEDYLPCQPNNGGACRIFNTKINHVLASWSMSWMPCTAFSISVHVNITTVGECHGANFLSDRNILRVKRSTNALSNNMSVRRFAAMSNHIFARRSPRERWRTCNPSSHNSFLGAARNFGSVLRLMRFCHIDEISDADVKFIAALLSIMLTVVCMAFVGFPKRDTTLTLNWPWWQHLFLSI